MADRSRAVAENTPGEFFVDATCIDCDTCRQLAPLIFGAASGTSYVRQQPADEASQRLALRALLACPTGSIGGHAEKPLVTQAIDDFPLLLAEPVSYCGFTAEESFGGS